MTMNLLWSDTDGPSAYIVTDSAGTHGMAPSSPLSVFGNTQHVPALNKTVEEGFQKIVRLNEHGAAVLCGTKADVDPLVLAIQEDLKNGGTAEQFMSYFTNISTTADFAVTLAIAGMTPPFVVIAHPQRELTLVERGHVHVEGILEGDHDEGSLESRAKSFIVNGVRRFLVDKTPAVPPDARLAAALAIATAANIEYDLVNIGIGGAFFGAIVDGDGFHWQPDITYFLYDRGFADEMPEVTEVRADTPGKPSSLTSIACRVRDDVCVAISSIDMRGVAAGRMTAPSEIQKWMNKWQQPLEKKLFSGAKYCAFVPTQPGQIVIAPNDGRYIQEPVGRVAMSNVLIDALNLGTADGRFGLAFLL